MAKKQTKTFRIYKPNRNKNGAASSIEFRREDKEYGKLLVFWTATQQTGEDANGNAAFGWKDPSKTVKTLIGTNDLAELLAVLEGVKQYVGIQGKNSPKPSIFHKNEKGNKSLTFGKLDDGSGYEFRMSSKENGVVVAVAHKISLEEGIILRIILTEIVKIMYSLGDKE